MSLDTAKYLLEHRFTPSRDIEEEGTITGYTSRSISVTVFYMENTINNNLLSYRALVTGQTGMVQEYLVKSTKLNPMADISKMKTYRKFSPMK